LENINQVKKEKETRFIFLSSSFLLKIYSTLTCTGLKADGTPGDATTGNLAKIVQPLIDQGIIVKCFSWRGTTDGGSGSVYAGDENLRFGATALIYDAGELKAWSVDENGVVKWDTADLTSANPPGGDGKSLSNAKDACANNGGRLPSIEQLRSLSLVWYSKTSIYNPLGFATGTYWSSTPIPSLFNTHSYFQNMSNGNLAYYGNNGELRVRCVR